MFMLVLILNNPERVNDVLDAWEEAGVGGATILHSTGLGRIRRYQGFRDDLPLIPSLNDFVDHEEQFSRTIFTVCKDEPLADKLVEVTQKILGDLDEPDTGIMVVLPVIKAYGVVKRDYK